MNSPATTEEFQPDHAGSGGRRGSRPVPRRLRGRVVGAGARRPHAGGPLRGLRGVAKANRSDMILYTKYMLYIYIYIYYYTYVLLYYIIILRRVHCSMYTMYVLGGAAACRASLRGRGLRVPKAAAGGGRDAEGGVPLDAELPVARRDLGGRDDPAGAPMWYVAQRGM